MGTNYYWHEPSKACPTCGNDTAEVYHIGKSSDGWCFALNTHPERGLKTLADWRRVLWHGEIRDEYNALITPDEMLAEIVERGANNRKRHDVLSDGLCIENGGAWYDLMRGVFC